MSKQKKIGIGVIIGIAVIAALVLLMVYTGMGPRIGGGGDDVVYVQPVSDLTGYSLSADRYSGVVESQKAVTYKRDTSRKIEDVYVKVGDVVKKGAKLYKYDVRSSENNIASIRLDIESLNNEIAYLQTQGGGTEIQLKISERQLEIKQKQADIEKYQKEIDQAEVLSTIDGVIKGVGDYSDDAESDILITMTEIGEFRVKGTVSEQSIGTLYAGMPIIIRSRVNETETWRGSISKIETEPETNNNEDFYYYGGGGESSSTYPFYVSLDSTVGLMLGQHVYIEPDYGQGEVVTKEGIWIDQSFVVTGEDGDDPFVWIDNNGRLAKRTVQLGDYDENDFTVEIVSGLSEDDLIAWADETLKEGMKTANIKEV